MIDPTTANGVSHDDEIPAIDPDLAAHIFGASDEDDLERSAIVEEASAKKVQTERARPIVLSGDRGEALLAKPAPVKWICRGLQLPAGGGRPLLFVAYGGSGKTWCVLDLALAVATRSRKCIGALDVQNGGPVLWLNFEMSRNELIRRTQRIAFARKVPPHANGDFEILSRQHLAGLTLNDPRMKPALIAALNGRALCVVDSFRASIGGIDENASEVRRPLDDLLEISDVTGCSFVVVHHEGKPGDTPRAAIHRTRGSGSIVDASDSTFHLVCGEAALRLEQGKASLGERVQPIHIRLRDVGALDPDTGRSQGLSIEWLPEEQLAELEEAQSPAVVRARAAIIAALRIHPSLNSNQITRSSSVVKGKSDAKRDALGWLEADGVIVGNRSGWRIK